MHTPCTIFCVQTQQEPYFVFVHTEQEQCFVFMHGYGRSYILWVSMGRNNILCTCQTQQEQYLCSCKLGRHNFPNYPASCSFNLPEVCIIHDDEVARQLKFQHHKLFQSCDTYHHANPTKTNFLFLITDKAHLFWCYKTLHQKKKPKQDFNPLQGPDFGSTHYRLERDQFCDRSQTTTISGKDTKNALGAYGNQQNMCSCLLLLKF